MESASTIVKPDIEVVPPSLTVPSGFTVFVFLIGTVSVDVLAEEDVQEYRMMESTPRTLPVVDWDFGEEKVESNQHEAVDINKSPLPTSSKRVTVIGRL